MVFISGTVLQQATTPYVGEFGFSRNQAHIIVCSAQGSSGSSKQTMAFLFGQSCGSSTKNRMLHNSAQGSSSFMKHPMVDSSTSKNTKHFVVRCSDQGFSEFTKHFMLFCSTKGSTATPNTIWCFVRSRDPQQPSNRTTVLQQAKTLHVYYFGAGIFSNVTLFVVFRSVQRFSATMNNAYVV